MVATSEEPTEPADELRRERIAAPHSQPDVDECIDTEIEVVRREPRAVHRTDGGSDHDVGSDALPCEGPKHPGLDGSEIAAAGEYERGGHRPPRLVCGPALIVIASS